ncbi:hypothetical protein HDV00_005359 [Rhizophlyctis rosea]|nr:hypothetical protein HDV00_005359 [Rhizophlyctis rosea]
MLTLAQGLHHAGARTLIAVEVVLSMMEAGPVLEQEQPDLVQKPDSELQKRALYMATPQEEEAVGRAVVGDMVIDYALQTKPVAQLPNYLALTRHTIHPLLHQKPNYVSLPTTHDDKGFPTPTFIDLTTLTTFKTSELCAPALAATATAHQSPQSPSPTGAFSPSSVRVPITTTSTLPKGPPPAILPAFMPLFEHNLRAILEGHEPSVPFAAARDRPVDSATAADRPPIDSTVRVRIADSGSGDIDDASLWALGGKFGVQKGNGGVKQMWNNLCGIPRVSKCVVRDSIPMIIQELRMEDYKAGKMFGHVQDIEIA